MPQSRRDRSTAQPATESTSSGRREQRGPGNGWLAKLTGWMRGEKTSEQTPLLDAAEEQAVEVEATPAVDEEAVAEEVKLAVFPGYEDPWQQANDALIHQVVMEFNKKKGWTADHEDFLDPDRVKAWALQESGGHADIFSSGDMMQMNNPGDWAKEKEQFGLTKGQKLSPEQSLRAALEWAYYKGEITRAAKDDGNPDWHDTQRGDKSVDGYQSKFTDWDTALDNYNGGGVADYSGDIDRRYKGRRDSASTV